MRAARRTGRNRGGLATGVRRDAPQDAHARRMRKCEGQSGPAAPDRFKEYTAAEPICQGNNIIKCSRFEWMDMSLVLLWVEAVEIRGYEIRGNGECM